MILIIRSDWLRRMWRIVWPYLAGAAVLLIGEIVAIVIENDWYVRTFLTGVATGMLTMFLYLAIDEARKS